MNAPDVVYILAENDEYGIEDAVATRDPSKLPAMLAKMIAENKNFDAENIVTAIDELNRVLQDPVFNTCGNKLVDGWGGPKLYVLRVDADG